MNTNVSSPTQMSAVASSTGIATVSQEISAVEKAVAEFSKKAGVTPEEILEFRSALEFRIQESGENPNSKAGRKERKAHLARVSENIGTLGFVVVRNKVRTPTVSNEMKHSDLFGILNLIKTPPEVSSQGGLTFAYMLHTEVECGIEILYATVALAVCRQDENFDPLFGKELALERLSTDLAITVPFRGSVFERNGFNEDTMKMYAVELLGTVLNTNQSTIDSAPAETSLDIEPSN